MGQFSVEKPVLPGSVLSGNQQLVIERRTAEFLVEKIALSGSDKALLHRLHQQFTQNGHLHERAPIYIELVVPGGTIRKEERCVKIPIDLINPDTFGSPSQFLTEDANYDGRLIDFVLRSVRDVTGAPTFKFLDEHGGGASTLQRYESGLRGKKIGICVLDTDRRSPFAEICSLTKRAMGALEASEWRLFDVVPLPCHELENVIPHCVVMMLDCAVGCDWNAKIPRIEYWESVGRRSGDEAFWLFFDVKNGLSEAEFDELSEKEIAWLQPRLNVLGAMPAGWAFPGYGRGVVAQLLESNKALDALRKAIRNTAWQQVFSEYFLNIIWFGAASTRVNT